MSEAYTKHVEWHFKVRGQVFCVEDIGDDGSWVEVRETRCNGQEDTHMSGMLVQTPSGWEWEDGEHLFVTYGSQELADGICKHLNTHGIPKEQIPN